MTLVAGNPLNDPAAQQKIAENILNQLGLHPNQLGARSLLDTHFQSPDAVPEVKAITQPLVSGNAPVSGVVQPPVSDTPNPVKEETAPQPKTDQPMLSATPQPKPPVANSLPTIPPPSFNPIKSNTDNEILRHQNELDRLIDTGSGIHQIKNPFLHGLATVGETVGSALFPGAMALTPGTGLHHDMLINQEEGRLNSALENKQKEAQTEHEEQETQNAKNKSILDPNELATWMAQNPGKSIDEYWTAKAQAQFGKLTPQQQVMRFLTLPREMGGLGLPVDEAFRTMNQSIADTKPPTAAEQKGAIMDLIAKTMPNGKMDPKLMADPGKLISMIESSPALTDPEKSKVFSYFLTNSSPASQGEIASIRTSPQMQNRFISVIDKNTGELQILTPEMFARAPKGQYIMAAQGGPALSKEQAFADIDFNTKNAEEAIRALKTPFDARQRAQFLLAMRSTDPKAAFDQFLSGSVGTTLAPDQVDFLTAIAALNENAMALRSIQGLGQGSDELRSAITKMIPTQGVPSVPYALRQLEIFKGTTERAKLGVPRTGINKPSTYQPRTTQEIINDQNNPQPEYKVGQVYEFNQGHYKYKGGDVNDQNSWEEVKQKGAKKNAK